jgi:hypothetical protein
MCHPAKAQAMIETQQLRDLAILSRVRDGMVLERAESLDVEALARADQNGGHGIAGMSPRGAGN